MCIIRITCETNCAEKAKHTYKDKTKSHHTSQGEIQLKHDKDQH